MGTEYKRFLKAVKVTTDLLETVFASAEAVD